jgi:glutathione S-transferase
VVFDFDVFFFFYFLVAEKFGNKSSYFSFFDQLSMILISSCFSLSLSMQYHLILIPAYITVPSMLPRPLLTSTFSLSYRKIPVLLIGRHLYCDTSLIIEALEHFFPPSAGYGTVYPAFSGLDEWSYKGLVRGFASFWTDKPFFRTTTGLIPPSVWSTNFGTDRAQLVGHKLNAEKLGSKIPQNLASLDIHLAMLEPGFKQRGNWAIPTPTPSLADISLYYQLRWGIDIASGKGIENLSGGATKDTEQEGTAKVFNEKRYPGLWSWFHAFEKYINGLPDSQTTNPGKWLDRIRESKILSEQQVLLPSAVEYVEVQRDLVPGVSVSVAPDDTGRDNPTVGTLVKIGVEEVVIRPNGKAEVGVLVHFPRLGFVVKVVDGARL